MLVSCRVYWNFEISFYSVTLTLHLCIFLTDSRTGNWFLMSSPLPSTIIIAIYVYFVTSLGPRIMENRKSLDLKGVLVLYNFSVVALSVYMIYEVSQSVHRSLFFLRPPPQGGWKTCTHYLICSLSVLTITNVILKLSMRSFRLLIKLFSQFIMSGWGTGYSFHCDLVDYTESPQALRVSHPRIPECIKQSAFHQTRSLIICMCHNIL